MLSSGIRFELGGGRRVFGAAKACELIDMPAGKSSSSKKSGAKKTTRRKTTPAKKRTTASKTSKRTVIEPRKGDRRYVRRNKKVSSRPR